MMKKFMIALVLAGSFFASSLAAAADNTKGSGEIRVGDYVYDYSTPRPWKICLPDAGAIWGGDGWW